MKYKGSVTPALEGPNADVATEFVEVQVPNEFRSTNGPMSRGCRIFLGGFLDHPRMNPEVEVKGYDSMSRLNNFWSFGGW